MNKNEIDLGDDILLFSENGFCLFNKEKRRYTIDASLWKSDKTIKVGDKSFKIDFIEKAEAVEVVE